MTNQITITEKSFLKREDGYWMTAQQLGKELGFAEPRIGVMTLYQRNKDELAPFASVIKMITEAGLRDTTVFNEQGCYIVAMLAKTEPAKIFRRGLAEFIKHVRLKQIADLKILRESAKARLTLHLQRCEKINLHALERIVKLKETGLISHAEIADAFHISGVHLYKLLKLHRETQGDFNNYQPPALKEHQAKQLTANS